MEETSAIKQAELVEDRPEHNTEALPENAQADTAVAPYAAAASSAAADATAGQGKGSVRQVVRESKGMKILSLVLFVSCCFLAYDIYYGHNGYLQRQKVEVQLEKAKQQSLVLKQRNQDLAAQIQDLQQGSVAVEELARSELGLIKPNERFYRVLADDKQILAMPVP